MGILKTKYDVGNVVKVVNAYDEFAVGHITEIHFDGKEIAYIVRLGFNTDIKIKENYDKSCNGYSITDSLCSSLPNEN